MERQIQGGLVAMTGFLIAGSLLFPNGAGMWLASTSLVINMFRGVLLISAVVLLVTNPPRSKLLRAVLSVASAGLAVWAVGRAFDGTVQIIDAMTALLASVGFGIAALEIEGIPTAQIMQPLQTPSSSPSIFAVNPLPVSDMQGIVIPRRKFVHAVQDTLLFTAITITAFYKGLRPYRAIWRGS